MYLARVHLKKFRKFKNITVEFNSGVNVLIGENDSGKTAIVDSIRYLLNTKSYESVRFEAQDFFLDPVSKQRADNFEVVAEFKDFKKEEAANFLEWGTFNADGDFELRVSLSVSIKSNNRIVSDLRAGPEGHESFIDGNAREFLKVTYLKPLRDAQKELTPGYHSRLAQILQSLKAFAKSNSDEKHDLEVLLEGANQKIKEYLAEVKLSDSEDSLSIVDEINEYVTSFKDEHDKREATINIIDPELYKILRSLGLELEDNVSGLGTLNKLFMAAELLHIQTDPYNSIRLCLIEELEAHLHPQAQLRVINTLRKTSQEKHTQFILSTHSTILGASVPLDNLLVCRESKVYNMAAGKTGLALGDYKFLQRFLDSTKANMFFAKGVILVEGDAENILVPTIAKLIGFPLDKYGVSVVNVGSTAFLRYANIFVRKDHAEDNLMVPVSIITDTDVRDLEYYKDKNEETPCFYKVPDKSIHVGGKDYDLSEIVDNYYLSLENMKEAIRDVLGVSKLPNGLGSHISEWETIKLAPQNIYNVREAKKKTTKAKYKFPVKVFMNEEWTLEYDLALSKELNYYFNESVEIAKEIKKSELSYCDYDDERLGEISKCDHKEELYISAYEVFKPFVSSNKPSKAVTAQIFSEIIESNPVKFKSIIDKEKNIAYIVDAIKYACGEASYE
ncbi:ATP-dependent nuclease [Vibrio parahaemolyticus]|uniref:ATP-dependent nuclease n=1 Tax=Vibrio parahaemolyticus TaxID=670 RepID=UPI00215CF188|nr:AAA family ATPase [Vibrio parahaemolyticus]MCR9841179.1 AAA family ATPase [Vibrio parahaemolyticus]